MILPLATAHCQSPRLCPQNWFHRQTRRSHRGGRVLLSCTTFDKYLQLLWHLHATALTILCNFLNKYVQLLWKIQSFRTFFFICSTFQGGRSCATRRLPKTLDLYWSFQFYHTLFSGINNICRNLCARLTQKHWIDSTLLSSYNQNITSLHLGSDKKLLILSQIGKYA